MFAKTAIVALFAAFAAAQLHEPVGDQPMGNPITRPLNEGVVAGTEFEITWTPTTENTVSLLLLKGAANDLKQAGDAIVEGIPNSGSYTWTVPGEYGPGLTETTGYGIQLIDDKTGQYQYSTQFGITIPDDYEVSSSTPSATPTSTKEGYPTGATKTDTITTKPTHVAPTGYPISNSSIIQPSKTLSVPSSLLTSTTSSPSGTAPPESTGAASHLQAGLGLAAGVAGLFFML